MKTEYTRDELIALCEAALVMEEEWRDRDSAGAQMQLGEAWALLRAGCAYKVLTGPKGSFGCVTDDRTIWLEIYFNGFNTFEGCGKDEKTFYLPTRKRLAEAKGKDWY